MSQTPTITPPARGTDVESVPVTAGAAPVNETVRTSDPVRFGKSAGFLVTLRQRIDTYFEESGKKRRDLPQMYLKTAIIMAWFVASYVGLVFFATAVWQAALLCVSLGFAMAAIGFNIQHDGGHNAYSDSKRINNLMAMTLDLLGGSSYLWKRTHNQIHHSYTNIDGHDDDIDLGVLGRLSPHQPSYWFHKAQHVYLWFLYGFLPFKWQLYDDLGFMVHRRIAGHRYPRPKGWELAVFIGGKLMFLGWALALPLFFHKWYVVLAAWFGVSWLQGVILSVVFQLAHVVEEADFPAPDEITNRIENEWAIHQVETTVDFARTSRLVNWFTGGLNYQIEHHLFPQICHLHYPALSQIVEETSKEFGVSYSAHQTFGAAVASHYRLLKAMGRPTSAA